MKKAAPKTLQEKIDEAVKGLKCPIHTKAPEITLKNQPAEADIECCCNSFKTDITVIVGRVLRSWNLHGEHLRTRKG
jgi:hypothetical protein